MFILYIVTAAALLASFVADRGKTISALESSAKRLLSILPVFLTMLIMFSVVMSLLPEELISRLVGRQSGWHGVAIASVVGSVTLMPGFVAFPLCAALLGQGVPYMVLSAFTTTLMSVGVLTYPIERRYLGRNVTLIRNVINFVIALVVALATGFVFREISL